MDVAAGGIGRRPRQAYGCIRCRARRGPNSTACVAAEGRGADDPVVTTENGQQVAALALDLGASRLRAAVVDSTGRVVARTEARAPVEAGPQGVIAAAIGMLRRVREEAPTEDRERIGGVGIAAPGPLDPATGALV